MAASLHYLTVQDVLWINLEATRKPNSFHYAKLEEATYYQYAYGESNTLLPQAGRFLAGFLKLHPFEAGNAATGFIAVLAFIRANGSHVMLDDGAATAWYERASANRGASIDALKQIIAPDGPADEPVLEEPHEHSGHDIGMRAWIRSVLVDFPTTVSNLSKEG
jgi:prophage maintenance system killer protein